MFKVFLFSMLTALTLLNSNLVSANDAQPSVQYVYLQPAFTANVGHAGRLRYVRTEIALKVSSDEAAEQIKTHMPYLRHEMIMLLSSQTTEAINTPKGRDQLRIAALDRLRGRMIAITEAPLIEELYFSNFVAQN